MLVTIHTPLCFSKIFPNQHRKHKVSSSKHQILTTKKWDSSMQTPNMGISTEHDFVNGGFVHI